MSEADKSRQSRLTALAVVASLCAIGLQYLRPAPIGHVFAAAIYFITWWTILFAVLPFGVRTQHDEGTMIKGTSAGAPIAPQLKRIVATTTIVASIVFCGILIALAGRLIPLEL